MPKFKTENYLGNAHNLIRQKIRRSQPYANARRAVLSDSQAIIKDFMRDTRKESHEALRSLGGYTPILRRAINENAPTDSMGSKLIPLSVKDILVEVLPELREELQLRIAHQR